MKTTTHEKKMTAAQAEWHNAMRVMHARIDEHVLARNELAAQLAKAREELAKSVATAARAQGEADALKLSMRMVSNTIIGKETYSSWAWGPPSEK